MSIYQYTLKKYMKSKSTWLIGLITFLLIFLMSGYVPFSVFDPNKKNSEAYAILSIALVSGITGFLAIFTSVFSGFKAASMFRDEVEDGTFLVILSKPIRRSKIIIYKWLALQTIIIAYTFLSALTFLLAIVIFDEGDDVKKISTNLELRTLRSRILIISSYMWMILFVSSLIFSSIALLLSTKISLGSTIGISIALGVIIPVTSLIGVFTKKKEYRPNYNPMWNTLSVMNDKNKSEGIINWTNSFKDDEYFLNDIYMSAQEEDSYKHLWPLDFNYHFSLMSKFAYRTLISEKEEEILTLNHFSGNRQILNSFYLDKTNIDSWGNDVNDNIKDYEYALAHTWRKKEKYRKIIIPLYILSISDELEKSFKFGEGFIQDFLKDNIFQAANINWVNNNDHTKGAILNQSQLKTMAAFFKSLDWIGNGTVNTKTSVERIKRYIKLFYSINDHIIHLYNYGHMKYISINSIQGSPEIKLEADKIARLVDSLIKVVDYNPTDKMGLFDVTVDTAIEPVNINPTNSKGETIKNSVALDLIKNFGEGISGYRNSASLIKKGYTLHKAELHKYADKSIVLYIYISIAFLLVPLSYLAIKRKDFR